MKYFCVIGYPIGHSRSPALHNAAFKKLKLRAFYEAVAVAPGSLGGFMRKFRKKYSGASVTIPHKEKIIEFLDIVDGTARKIGAVNTIVNKNGKLAGYNTDVIGVMNALKTGVRSFRGKKAA